jgi:hypothetical protein
MEYNDGRPIKIEHDSKPIDEMLHRFDQLIENTRITNRLVRVLIAISALQTFALGLLIIVRLF